MTDTIYKLTDHAKQTLLKYQWRLGYWHKTGGNGELCGPGWLHVYTDPLVGIMLNPVHANIADPRVFIGRGRGKMLDDHGLKRGYSKVFLDREMDAPKVTSSQRVEFGILSVLEVCRESAFIGWAEKWLSGDDRSMEAAAEADAKLPAATNAAAGAAFAAEWDGLRAARHSAMAVEGAARRTTVVLDLPALARRAMEVAP